MVDLIGSQSPPHPPPNVCRGGRRRAEVHVSTQKQALSMSETPFAASLGKATARQHRGKDRKQDSAITSYERMGACSLPTGTPPLPADTENALPHHACTVPQGVKSIWHGLVGRGGCFEKKRKRASESGRMLQRKRGTECTGNSE